MGLPNVINPAASQIFLAENFDSFQGRKSSVNPGKAATGGGEAELQSRAAAQQAQVQAMMDTLDREITRSMNDHAEIQRLRIVNARLALDNAKLEAALNA